MHVENHWKSLMCRYFDLRYFPTIQSIQPGASGLHQIGRSGNLDLSSAADVLQLKLWFQEYYRRTHIAITSSEMTSWKSFCCSPFTLHVPAMGTIFITRARPSLPRHRNTSPYTPSPILWQFFRTLQNKPYILIIINQLGCLSQSKTFWTPIYTARRTAHFSIKATSRQGQYSVGCHKSVAGTL